MGSVIRWVSSAIAVSLAAILFLLALSFDRNSSPVPPADLAAVWDDQQPKWDDPLPEPPPGCLGAPYLLLTFHGGMKKHPQEHGRYGSILKYTRDGCLMGVAVEREGTKSLSGTRLRGMRVFANDTLFVVNEGVSGKADKTIGNVMTFGSCRGDQNRSKPREMISHKLLDDKHAASCSHHLFGIASPDDGASLFMTSQEDGTIVRYSRQGQALGSSKQQCPGLFAKLEFTEEHKGQDPRRRRRKKEEKKGSCGQSVRGVCFDSRNIMYVPDKKSASIAVIQLPTAAATDARGEHSVILRDTKSKGKVELTTYGSGQYLRNLGGKPGVLEWASHASGTGEIFTHSPSICRAVDRKLYFNVRKHKKTGKGITGIVEYDLNTDKVTRLFSHPDLHFPKSFVVTEDSLFVVDGDDDNIPSVGDASQRRQGRRRGKMEDKFKAIERSNILHFNITTGEMVRVLISKHSPSHMLPDLPEQIELSWC